MRSKQKKANQPQTIEILDRVEGEEGMKNVEVTLIPHMEFLGTNDSELGLWSASFRYFDVRCTLRERPNAFIQCKAGWVGTKSGVKSTGTKVRAEAIQWAADEMREAHFARLKGGERSGEEEPQASGEGLRFSEAVWLLRDRNLLPGSSSPGASAVERKTQAPYELILDIARVVWAEDPFLSEIDQSHIDRMYDARVKPAQKGRDAEGIEGGEEWQTRNPLDEPAFEWPPHIDRKRPVGWVKPQTVQGDLQDLRVALGKLIGTKDEKGRKYLTADPLKGLDLGDHEKVKLPEAGPHRYAWVIRYADQAVERIRTTGYEHTERRRYRRGDKDEIRPYNRTEKFPEIIPGMLRILLVLQFGHPTRPRAIRHIRVNDTARTRAELVRLFHSLGLRKSDKALGEEVFDVWPEGAIAYRRAWSKLNTERMVPFSADIAAEFDRYMEKRTDWMAEGDIQSSWLFPSPRDPRKPISQKDMGFLLACGEELAREMVAEAGKNPEELVPDLHKTGWYAYRRYWKTLRNRMGWEGNSNAAYVGDWSTKQGSTADVVYAGFAPRFILAVVEGKTILEALETDDGIQETKRAARIRPDIDDGMEAE